MPQFDSIGYLSIVFWGVCSFWFGYGVLCRVNLPVLFATLVISMIIFTISVLCIIQLELQLGEQLSVILQDWLRGDIPLPPRESVPAVFDCSYSREWWLEALDRGDDVPDNFRDAVDMRVVQAEMPEFYEHTSFPLGRGARP